MLLLDVTHEIKIDHDNVRDLLERYKNETNSETKVNIANTLIREMAIHGDAEEISVYNHFLSLGLRDTEAQNKEEHAEIKRLVYEADTTSTSHDNYDQVLIKAVTTFISHAQEEENDQFPKIKASLTPEASDKMAREFLKARTSVPSRAHPMAPQSGGLLQKAADMQAKLHDKVIETVQGREFVPVKLSHPEV